MVLCSSPCRCRMRGWHLGLVDMGPGASVGQVLGMAAIVPRSSGSRSPGVGGPRWKDEGVAALWAPRPGRSEVARGVVL